LAFSNASSALCKRSTNSPSRRFRLACIRHRPLHARASGRMAGKRLPHTVQVRVLADRSPEASEGSEWARLFGDGSKAEGVAPVRVRDGFSMSRVRGRGATIKPSWRGLVHIRAKSGRRLMPTVRHPILWRAVAQVCERRIAPAG
jgi:hypothetical protein